MVAPLMYSEIADWWPLLSSPEEYEEEAGFFSRTLIEVAGESPKTVSSSAPVAVTTRPT